MADLLVNGTITVRKNQEANILVTIGPSGFAWSAYNTTSPGDGWQFYAPERDTTTTLSGLASTLENKTFTPLVSGRYVVKLVATLSSTGVQETLAAIYEVASVFNDESIPGPRELATYHAQTGWARSYEKHLSTLHKMLAGRRLVRVRNETGGSLAKHSLVKLGEFHNAYNARAAGALASDNLLDCGQMIAAAAATDGDILSSTIGVLLDTLPNHSGGLVLLDGPLFIDTSGKAVGDAYYITNTGTLSTTFGTNIRIVGVVHTVGLDNVNTAGTIGVLMFHGATPPQNFTGTQNLPIVSQAGPGTVTLVSLASVPLGREYIIIDANNNSSSNAITVATAGAETIDGSATNRVLQTDGGVLRLVKTAGDWKIVSVGPSPCTFVADTTSSAQTVTLPALAGWFSEIEILVLDTGNNASTNNVTVAPAGSDKINNVSGSALIASDSGAVRLRKESATTWRISGIVD